MPHATLPAVHTKMMMLLLLLAVFLAIYDLRTRRVPNWVTLSLLVAGLRLQFPGAPETWLGCLLLFSAWRFGAIGGGDAKLWMAFLWLAPANLAQPALLVMAAAFLFTAMAQVIWRKLRGHPIWGLRSPGAWRVIPFALWLLAVNG